MPLKVLIQRQECQQEVRLLLMKDMNLQVGIVVQDLYLINWY